MSELNDTITPLWFFGSEGTASDSNIGRFSIATAAGLFASNFQPLDADLTSIAALSTASYGRSFLVQADAAGGRSYLGLGSFATVTPTGTPDGSKFLRDDNVWTAIPDGGDALTSNPLSQFASTTSDQLRGVISDETGTGQLVFATSPTLVTPALGTPSSGTLTNCTGLPIAGLVASTSAALGVGSIEIGHDSDTTLARVSAGVVSIEGVNIVTVSATQTLTNKTLTSPTLTTPTLGTPASGALTNCTGYPYSALVSPPTLGSIASQNSNSVTITGGSISGITDLAIADGGTGQSTAQNAINALTQVSAATNEHVLTKDTATGNATWKAAAGGGGGAVDVGIQQFRLTTESGVSVSSSDRTAQSTIYLTPHVGNQIALYDGSEWQLRSSAEVSLVLSGLTSARNYDVFAYWSGSAVVLELSTVWTNDTTRADAIVSQDGVWCKSGALTRRLVGTIRTTATTTTEDSELRRLVWNVNNQFRRRLFFDAGSSSHTYASSTVRQYNGSSAAQVDFVRGLATGSDIINTTVQCTTGGTTSNPGFGVGVNSTSSLLTGSVSNVSGVSMTGRIGAPAVFNAQVGYNYLALLQANFTGAGSPTFDLGRMLGEVLC